MKKIIALVAAAALVVSPVSLAQTGLEGAGVSAATAAAGGTFAFSAALASALVALGVAFTVVTQDDDTVIIVPPPPPPTTTTTTTN